MKITILASVWAKNLWDELILKNEIQYFQSVYGKNTEFFVATYDMNHPFIVGKNIHYFEYFPCDAKKIKNIFRNIKNFFMFLKYIRKSDLVVIGGGGIFFDNEGKNVKNPLKQWKMRVNICKIFKKKIRFHAVWVHIKNPAHYKILTSIFSWKNTDVTLRDISSQNILQECGISSEIIPDPVFSDKKSNKNVFTQNYFISKIHPKQFHTEDIDSLDLEWKTIWISFRKGYFYEDAKTIWEIITIIQKKWWNIILLPTSFHPTDKYSNDYIFLKYFAQKYNIKITSSMGETYKYFRENKIDICFSMRLHSMILSQVYKIPFVAFSYSKKTDELIKILSKSSKKWKFFLTNKNYLLLSKQLKK